MNRSPGRSRRYGHPREINEINVMPLVDLLMQLFIAAIIFFPVVEYGMGIDLPKETMDEIKQEQTRTLSITKQGQVLLNDVPMSLPQLRSQLAALARSRPPVTVLVKADQANNYGVVMSVLKELYAAKITRIALMTQEEDPPNPGRKRFARR